MLTLAKTKQIASYLNKINLFDNIYLQMRYGGGFEIKKLVNEILIEMPEEIEIMFIEIEDKYYTVTSLKEETEILFNKMQTEFEKMRQIDSSLTFPESDEESDKYKIKMECRNTYLDELYSLSDIETRMKDKNIEYNNLTIAECYYLYLKIRIGEK